MTEDISKKYDLTEKMMPFLDRHLMFPLIESLSAKGIYDEATLVQLKYDLLSDTNMVDYIEELWSQLNNNQSPPAELKAKRDAAEAASNKYHESTTKVLELFANPEVTANLKQDKQHNLQMLESQYNLTSDMINDLYTYGQFQYNCGNYHAASDLLYHYRILSTDAAQVSSATWGKFAADTLNGDWESSLEELQKLRDTVDQRSSFSGDPLAQLHHRTWIIHWALFPLFKSENGRDHLIDLFFSSSYISTIQAACPWLLRYLVAAVVTLNRGHSSASFQRRLKDVIRVVNQEQYEYQDPLTEFIRALYIEYDFEEAQAKLAEAEAILKNDFFLSEVADQFLESARHLVSELYCRIHQRIDVGQLSARLNLTPEQGEKWIANLIQGSKMDAKIDESEGTVIMNHPATSVYQQVIEKTKGLTFRSNQVLNQTMNKHEAVA